MFPEGRSCRAVSHFRNLEQLDKKKNKNISVTIIMNSAFLLITNACAGEKLHSGSVTLEDISGTFLFDPEGSDMSPDFQRNIRPL
jgi:hypothetical protein